MNMETLNNEKILNDDSLNEDTLSSNVKRIVNKGEITRNDLIKLTKNNSIRSGLSFSVIGVIISIIGVSLLVSTLTNNFDAKFLPYVLIPCGVIITLLPLILGLFAPVFVDKQNRAIAKGFKYKYQFDESEMDITLDSGVAKLHQKLNYLLIYKVQYFDDVVCIYLNSSVVYMFKLSGFENDLDKNKVMIKIDKSYKVK